MTPLPRSIIFWTLFALLLLVGWMIGHGAEITQGAGAKALVRTAKSSLLSASVPVPASIVVPPHYRTYYFAATATGANGLESDYGNEAVLTVTNRITTVTCAWDKPSDTNAISSYTLYQGSVAGTYTNNVQTTNTQATIQVNPPVPTNLVLTVTSVGLTNIAWCEKLKGNWKLLGVTNFVTNAVSAKMLLFRGLGRPATPTKKLYWQSRLQ